MGATLALGSHRPNRTHRPLVEQGMKKRHLIAAGILVAVVAMPVSLWVNEGPLWRWVMTKRVRLSEHPQPALVEGTYLTF